MFSYLWNLFKTQRLNKLAQACGSAHGPSLCHSVLNPDRPVIRVLGDHATILLAFTALHIQLSREMQGDRFGTITINDATISFGLVITRRDAPEMFIEIAKYQALDRAKEFELLRMLFEHLKHQTSLQMELVEP
jgi:hypothetical protein